MAGQLEENSYTGQGIPDAIAALIAPGERLFAAKPCGRKSLGQPHTWLLCNRQGPRFAVKFGLTMNEPSCGLVRRETEFYSKTSLLSRSTLTGRVPRLIKAGDLWCGPYLALAFHRGNDPTRWMSRGLRWAPGAVFRWQARMLAMLKEIQGDAQLRRCLGISCGQVLCHGDFNHFNILNNGKDAVILDWENWGAGPPFMDALHVLAVVTLAGDTVEKQADSFQGHWLRDCPYRRNAIRLLEPFLLETTWQEAMAQYLAWQIASLRGQGSENRLVFERCEELWRSRG
jgi:hypothetical protein